MVENPVVTERPRTRIPPFFPDRWNEQRTAPRQFSLRAERPSTTGRASPASIYGVAVVLPGLPRRLHSRNRQNVRSGRNFSWRSGHPQNHRCVQPCPADFIDHGRGNCFSSPSTTSILRGVARLRRDLFIGPYIH